MQIRLCKKVQKKWSNVKRVYFIVFLFFLHPPLCLCLIFCTLRPQSVAKCHMELPWMDSIHLLSECCTNTDLTEGRCKKRPQWRLLCFATSSQLADCRYPLTSNKCPSLLPLSANVCKTWERKICHFCRLSLYCYWVEIENAIADDKWQRETQTSPQIRERHRTGRCWGGVRIKFV